jgi:hypothetical protein
VKTKRDFQEVLASSFTPLVVLPASKPGESREQGKARANDLAVTARIDGLGVTVVESTNGQLFVVASDKESQAVGFARRLVQESKSAEPWFVLLSDEKDLLLKENADRSRGACSLREAGFVLPNGRNVEIVAAYVPAQRNTAWGHHLGHDVGEQL